MQLFLLFLLFHVALANFCPEVKKCKGAVKNSPKYKCVSDRNCFRGYRCCPHGCFRHNVCLKVKSNSLKDCPKHDKCLGPVKTDVKLLCDSDENCDEGTKCCPHPCFTHRVCLKRSMSTSQKIETESKKIIITSNNCVLEYKKCSKVPIIFTQHMKCLNNFECPEEYFCCEDACYEHKICKKGFFLPSGNNSTSRGDENGSDRENVRNDEEQFNGGNKVPLDEDLSGNKSVDEKRSNPLCSKLENENLGAYPHYLFSCGHHRRCREGETCCPSKRFKHNICIKIENKNEREKADGKNVKENRRFSCPLEDKCSRKHSITLAMKRKCRDNDECKINELCCFDVCAQFKICKDSFTF